MCGDGFEAGKNDGNFAERDENSLLRYFFAGKIPLRRMKKMNV